MTIQSDRRFIRGYLPKLGPNSRERLRALATKSPRKSIGRALLAHAAIVLAAALPTWLFFQDVSAILVAVSLIPAMLVIIREMRVLELLVHDASHGNWINAPRHRNHRLANWLAGYPMMSDTSDYWQSHRIHHSAYGSDDDPCKHRYARMRIGQIADNAWATRLRAVLAWLPGYSAGYYNAIGSSPRILLIATAWHIVVYILPLSLIFDIPTAIVIWALYWALPMAILLPVLRSVAEAEEHDYDRANTEFDTTFVNGGRLHKWLFHPWQDSYHLVHHMYPSIPQHRHADVHALLMTEDNHYRAGLHRTHVLEVLPRT